MKIQRLTDEDILTIFDIVVQDGAKIGYFDGGGLVCFGGSYRAFWTRSREGETEETWKARLDEGYELGQILTEYRDEAKILLARRYAEKRCSLLVEIGDE